MENKKNKSTKGKEDRKVGQEEWYSTFRNVATQPDRKKY